MNTEVSEFSIVSVLTSVNGFTQVTFPTLSITIVKTNVSVDHFFPLSTNDSVVLMAFLFSGMHASMANSCT